MQNVHGGTRRSALRRAIRAKVFAMTMASFFLVPMVGSVAPVFDSEARAMGTSQYEVRGWWIFKRCTKDPCPGSGTCCGSVGF